MATLGIAPLNLSKCKATPLINGVQVEAFRDTGASVTVVSERLMPPEQYLHGQIYQVTNSDNVTKNHPMAVVNVEWEGVLGPKQVVVCSAIPVEALLGNDLGEV